MGDVITYNNEEGEEVTLRCKFEVCHRCRGTGTHVNPAVDGHGISPEEFAEDPDFEEAYFSGVYDVRCEECNGDRVVPVPDPERNSPEAMAGYEAWLQEEYEYRQMCEMERRMGA
jgi:hypothetical protein